MEAKKQRNFKVIVRLRPRANRDDLIKVKDYWTITGNVLQCSNKSFEYEHLFGPTSLNSDVFAPIAPMVQLCKKGFNATILTYGQSFSGKTHTMVGNDSDPGMIMMAIRHIFRNEETSTQTSPGRQFIIRVGYIEIHNENLYDLLNCRQPVSVSFAGKGINVNNIEVIVKDEATVLKLLQKGNDARISKSGCTNQFMARSHTIFQIIIESRNPLVHDASVQVGRLNLVDTDSSEGGQTDKSLHYLNCAIKVLSRGKKYQGYSKSKLTYLLKTSLRGNSYTAIICNISPTALNQTVKTLNFADKAKIIKTSPTAKKSFSDNLLMNQVPKNILRLKTLMSELESFVISDPGTFQNEIRDLESLILSADNMIRSEIQQKPHFLKIRPASLDASNKKYQIGEIEYKCDLDARSRWSEFYLERVGFEINTKMRKFLKFGENLVGRSDVDDNVDICVDALECSRKQCHITVCDNSTVTITDLNSTNGTTINGVKYKGQTVDLKEGDIISIVSGQNLPGLVGNFDHTVYRLCKSTTDKVVTYDVDDDYVIELSDTEENAVSECMNVVNIKVEKVENETPPSSLAIEAETCNQTKSTEVLEPVISSNESPVFIDVETPDDDIYKTIELSDNEVNDGTSNLPVKMELETITPSISIDNDNQEETCPPDVLELPVVTLEPANPCDLHSSFVAVPSQDASSCNAPSSFVECETLNETEPLELGLKQPTATPSTSDGFLGFSASNQKNDDEFDLERYIFTDSTLDALDVLDGVNIASTANRDQDLAILQLGDFAQELDVLSNAQNENLTLLQNLEMVKRDNKLLTEKIETAELELKSAQAKAENLQLALTLLKTSENREKNVLMNMQSKLMKVRQEKNALKRKNMEMAHSIAKYVTEIDYLKAALKDVQDDRDSLAMKNVNHINEILEHFQDRNRASENDRP